MNHNQDDRSHIANVYGMTAHQCRVMAVEAVHARPYLLIEAPRSLIQLVFMNGGDYTKDHATMNEVANSVGAPTPNLNSPFHGITWEQDDLHCEKHTEFSTYLWSTQLHTESGELATTNPFKNGFIPPAPLLCGIRIDVLPWTEGNAKITNRFDSASLCQSTVEDGKAEIITDFRQDAEGLTYIVVLNKGLSPTKLGVLVQKLMEIETHRTLALLGEPMAQSMLPRIRKAEQLLTEITEEIRTSARSNSDKLLSQLTDLSAELEADRAAILYRFTASRSYYEVMLERLAELDEKATAGNSTWQKFLQRRIAPAMRTCNSLEQRLANLSNNTGNTISLLSSWVNVQLEHQNSELLQSMNNRSRLQLQLQQTVEGLSVAAISYYVLGLLGRFISGIPSIHDIIEPGLLNSMMVPVVILIIWWTVRRIRLSHNEIDKENNKDNK